MKSEINDNTLFDIATSLLAENHSLSYKLKGNSMFPVLREGDVAEVIAQKTNQLKNGDIVVFRSDSGLVAHRIINIQKQNNALKFTTRGDNSRRNDSPFGEEQLLGKIHFFFRNGQKHQINRLTTFYRKSDSTFVHTMMLAVNKIMFRFATVAKKFSQLTANIRLIATGSGKLLLNNAIISVIQGVLPFALIVCIKYLTDFLTQNQLSATSDLMKFYILLIITALVFLSTGVLNELRSLSFEKLAQSVTSQIYRLLHQKHASLDLSYYENPEQQNKIHRAVQEASFRPLKIINGLLSGIKSVAAAVFLTGIFVSIKWYLVLMLLLAIVPDLLVRIRFSRKYYRMKTEQSATEREMYYHNRVLTGFPFAKEQKLFGFSAYFLLKFNALQNKLFHEKLSIRRAEFAGLVLAQIFAVLLIFGALASVAMLKVNGLITIGTVVLFFFAFQRGYSVLNELFRSFTQFIEDNTYLNDFTDFLQLSPQVAVKKDTNAEFKLSNEIRIEHLNFSYDTSKRLALQDVNISIPVGKTVALVGPNGSGKSTLIKLLCGFYQPQNGQILFDGISSENIGGEQIRENISAVFQDFALYNVSAEHNIALGRSSEKPNAEKVKAAAKLAGIDEVLENLPKGYETLLGNLFAGGEELSIGQWQKLAIARAFYRDAPLLLLDEPSSALDIHSEKQIIQCLKELSRNKTAVIVSHRLSTVQWADIIYLFENGQVVESGSHEELLGLNGKYAELFRLAGEIPDETIETI